MSLEEKIGNFFKEKGKGLAKGIACTGIALTTLLGISRQSDALQLEIVTEPWSGRWGVVMDGALIQFIWVGNNGKIDDPIEIFGPYDPFVNALPWWRWWGAGSPPLGDDQLIYSNPEWPSFGAPAEQGTLMGHAWTGNYLSDPYPEPPDASIYLDPANNITAANPYVYVRVFEYPGGGWCFYGNSQLGWVDTGSPGPWQVFLPGGEMKNIFIPEPSTLLLGGAGLTSLLSYIYNRKKKEEYNYKSKK